MSDWLTEAARRPIGGRCTSCDGTGDVHRLDGEWLGYCYCAAGTALKGTALPDGMLMVAGKPCFECVACEKWTPWPGEIEDFDLADRSGHYCGGSPRCCP